MNEEQKFKLREIYYEYKIILNYFLKEPIYEFRRLISGYYNSILLFWLTLMAFILFWKSGIGGISLKIMGILVLITYFYMFKRSNRWKEYYNQEYLEGKKIE